MPRPAVSPRESPAPASAGGAGVAGQGGGLAAETARLGDEPRGVRHRAPSAGAMTPSSSADQLPRRGRAEGKRSPSSQPSPRSRSRAPPRSPTRPRASRAGPAAGADQAAGRHVQRAAGNGWARPQATQRSSRGRWPSRSTARTAKPMVTRGRREATALQGAQAPHGEAEEGRVRIAVGGQPGQSIRPPTPPARAARGPRGRRRRDERCRTGRRGRARCRPVSKKTSSPSVNSSSALPKRDRIRRAERATPRTLPYPRV